MIIYSQPVFFAWFRRTLHTPASQGRAGASPSSCAKRLHHEGPSRARLGLERWGKLCRPEPGRQTSSRSRGRWSAAQLWPQRQHLLSCRQRSARAAACDMRQLRAQS